MPSKLLKEAKKTLNKQERQTSADHLINQFQIENSNPGTGTEPIPGTYLFELRANDGIRIIFRKKMTPWK